MESPVIHPESPMEQEDIPFPCMGCGEILEEGKAFELFATPAVTKLRISPSSPVIRPSVLSASDAATARERSKTCAMRAHPRASSVWIVMNRSCSEDERKKPMQPPKNQGGPGTKYDKSLPSLPPSMEETRSIDETHTEAFAEIAVENRPDTAASEPAAADDNLLLPSSTYRSSRQISAQRDTNTTTTADNSDAGGELLIPLAFDPSASQRSSSRAQPQITQELPRDYFGQVRSGESSVRASFSLEPPSRASSEHPSPHIAYQEKGWDKSDDTNRRDTDGVNGTAKSFTASMDATISKIGRTESARSSRSDLPLALRETSAFSGATSPDSTRSKEATAEITRSVPQEPAVRPSNELRRLHDHTSMESARSQQSAYPPKRGDSLESKLHSIPRKEVGASPASSTYAGSPKLDGSLKQPKQSINTSITTPISDTQRQLDGAGSPSIARYPGSEFSDIDLPPSDSFFRRVSNSVRHGRSFSEKSVRLGKEGRSPRSPTNTNVVGPEVASPTASIAQNEEISWLRNELQKERQRISEMENALRATADVKQEIVLRELTVLTDHIEAEKRGNAGQPLDLAKLSNHVLRELAEAIHKLKESYTPQIEELIQKRNELNEELGSITRQKEKSFQEFEQLSSKNAQLAELNNQLVHQIQELYKNNPEGHRGPNGLGISHNKGGSIPSIEHIKPSFHDFPTSVSTAHIGDEGEPATATVVPGPQVVSIRKGQPRKFNWKKGGQNVAKGVKGLKGAFMGSEQEGGAGGLPRSQTQDPSRQGFGFFGNQRNKQGGKMSQADSVPTLAEIPGTTLFGTDLEARMEHEKSIIPAIVTRCIQEVELRGMDMEGIYRKSGAASAIQGIREGFERSPFDYDISDPDLDIHAVTSALKQYFRKLPTPLITYDVYDMIIDYAEIPTTAARVEHLVENLKELPRVHRDVLEFLIFHLKRVVERQDENLMTSQNVAVVFAPTIMRPESLAREMTDVQKKNDVLKFLVENCQDIFQGMQG
ncbi:hypothetical protein N7509_011995 [Penicillium cosmopolitanum]|uniref:Rho-GAP domain-containing protein n=1 Tax=Penicillium cosmopolitanum TaxID=1131564 RepID=A0A9W9SHU2_9EURO|nr:uncharacterized protein N7509_011995 [Penicillium cosmopolitanum]KAJ5378876.1 hypothetical protein N7509_011995 [Penicillium cosmopolitanum]